MLYPSPLSLLSLPHNSNAVCVSVTCHNFYLCQLMPHSFNVLYQYSPAPLPHQKLSIKCVSVMANSPAFACPPAPPPAIVGLLVCPRIDVILCRGLRFSFSFCLALPPLQLLALLLSILPPLNHILCQGRKDAVVKRGGSERGSSWFRWLRLLLLGRFRPTLARPWDLFDFLFNVFATVFIFFY